MSSLLPRSCKQAVKLTSLESKDCMVCSLVQNYRMGENIMTVGSERTVTKKFRVEVWKEKEG